MRLEGGSPFPVSIVPFGGFNSFHKVSMALVNNYRSELIKWPPRQALILSYPGGGEGVAKYASTPVFPPPT